MITHSCCLVRRRVHSVRLSVQTRGGSQHLRDSIWPLKCLRPRWLQPVLVNRVKNLFMWVRIMNPPVQTSPQSDSAGKLFTVIPLGSNETRFSQNAWSIPTVSGQCSKSSINFCIFEVFNLPRTTTFLDRYPYQPSARPRTRSSWTSNCRSPSLVLQ